MNNIAHGAVLLVKRMNLKWLLTPHEKAKAIPGEEEH